MSPPPEEPNVFKKTDPNTWLQHFIDSASPMSRYKEPVFQLSEAQLNVSAIRQQTVPECPETPFLTDLRKEDLAYWIDVEQREGLSNSRFFCPQPGRNELNVLALHQDLIIRETATLLSTILDTFKEICVADPNTATSPSTKLTQKQFMAIDTPHGRINARAVGPVETRYYIVFHALHYTRRQVWIRDFQRKRGWKAAQGLGQDQEQEQEQAGRGKGEKKREKRPLHDIVDFRGGCAQGG